MILIIWKLSDCILFAKVLREDRRTSLARCTMILFFNCLLTILIVEILGLLLPPQLLLFRIEQFIKRNRLCSFL